ncbi:MAG: hypothetical protein KC444_08855 [Nitrosopumilus sp.]|nr:hypothetical protein [Nitrosopumilus sp.]
MDFEKDSEALEKALSETDHRIKKLEEHKSSASKHLGDSTDNNVIAETLRRLECNLANLHKKRALIMKELES